MLIIGRAPQARVFIGDDCVLQVETPDALGNARVIVWYRGTESRYTIAPKGDVRLDCGVRVVFVKRGKLTTDKGIKFGFDGPVSIPIWRAELLTPERRLAIRTAAGVPSQIPGYTPPTRKGAARC